MSASRFFATPSGTVYRLRGETWSVWYQIVAEWAPIKLPAKAVDWLLELDEKPLHIPWSEWADQALKADPVVEAEPQLIEEQAEWTDLNWLIDEDAHSVVDDQPLAAVQQHHKALAQYYREGLAGAADLLGYKELAKATRINWPEPKPAPVERIEVAGYEPARFSVWAKVPPMKGWGEIARDLIESEARVYERTCHFPISLQPTGEAAPGHVEENPDGDQQA